MPETRWRRLRVVLDRVRFAIEWLQRVWAALVAVALRATSSAVAPYGQVALRLERELGAGRHSVLVVGVDNDASAAEAATEIARSLAADLGHRIVLVDAVLDVVPPAAAEGETVPGLRDLLRASTISAETVQACLVATGETDIVRVGGGSHGGPDTVMRVESLRRVVQALTEAGDYTLFIASNILRGPRSLALAGLVDVVFLVAVEDETRILDLERAHRTLADCGAHRLGLLLASRQQAPVQA